MKAKKLFRLFILINTLCPNMCFSNTYLGSPVVNNITKVNVLESTNAVAKEQESLKHNSKMEKICQKRGSSQEVIEDSAEVSQVIEPTNCKNNILVLGEILNKMDELTSDIKSLQKEKKRDFYFSISGGKTFLSTVDSVAKAVMNVTILQKRIFPSKDMMHAVQKQRDVPRSEIIEDYSDVLRETETNFPSKDMMHAVQKQRDVPRSEIIEDYSDVLRETKTNFDWLGSLALGYYTGGNGRVEFEATRFNMTIKDEDPNKGPQIDEKASTTAIMFNLYYNPSIERIPFAPYVGFGAGLMDFKFTDKEKGANHKPYVAYQGKLGITYSLIPELKISLGYRYFNVPILAMESVVAHNVEAGLVFNF